MISSPIHRLCDSWGSAFAHLFDQSAVSVTRRLLCALRASESLLEPILTANSADALRPLSPPAHGAFAAL